jgi:hypothetical protein
MKLIDPNLSKLLKGTTKYAKNYRIEWAIQFLVSKITLPHITIPWLHVVSISYTKYQPRVPN